MPVIEVGLPSDAEPDRSHTVVPMKQSRKLLIDEVRQSCLDKISVLRGTQSPEEAFAAWVLGEAHRSHLDLAGAARSARAAKGASRTYREVAVLGYAIPCVGDPDLKRSFEHGLNWLSGRTPFAHGSPSYEVDGVSLLGLALGMRCCPMEKAQEWLASFLNRSSTSRIGPLDRALIGAAARAIGRAALAKMPEEPDLADMRVALSSRGVDLCLRNDDEELALKQALSGAAETETRTSALRMAVQLRVLDWLSHDASLLAEGKPTLEQVVGILQRIPAAMRRWRWDNADGARGKAVRWQIENEYHVQDLLWVMLSPLFPDLEDEESLPSVGHKHPRFDLGIPSLHTIIEVKFIRKGTSSGFAQITEEIAADHSLYRRAGSNYDKMIVFVWDDSCSTEQHDELRQGMKQMSGIVDVVVVPRPAKMTRE